MKKMYVCYLYHYAIKKPMFTQAAILSKKNKKNIAKKMGDANSCHISKDRIGQVSTNNAHYQIYMSPKHCIVNSVRERIANVIAILSVLSTSMSITLVRRCVNNCVFIAANNKTPTPIPTVNRRRSRFFIMLISSLFWSSSGA
mmetsp:Transcript_18405/g.27965  ORF Transcript_18405/g.27965 Transcript_18405/m.27965 type:complete len:143 (-) Transcript_18405:504-932(-)